MPYWVDHLPSLNIKWLILLMPISDMGSIGWSSPSGKGIKPKGSLLNSSAKKVLQNLFTTMSRPKLRKEYKE